MSASSVRRPAIALAAAAGIMAASCEGTAPTGPADAFVIARTLSGEYAIERRAIPIDDLHTLTGIDFRYEKAHKLSARAGAVSPEWSIEESEPLEIALSRSGGAYRARDYEALIALTSAHHFATAFAHFRSIGLGSTVGAIGQQRVVFYPSLGSKDVPVENNAFYGIGLGGFAILRENGIGDLPLAANEGVLTHEVAHAIHSATRNIFLEAYAADRIGTFDMLEFAALDEGMADVHGAAQTGDPDFLRPSFRSTRKDVADQRRLDVARVFDDETATADLFKGDIYAVGSVFASAYWAFGDRLALTMPRDEARRTMAKVALEAQTSLRPVTRTGSPADAGVSVLSEFVRLSAERARAAGAEPQMCASIRAQLDAARAGVCP